MDLKDYQKQFILHLFNTGAIKFGEFELKSGRISPYFINMGLSIKDGESSSKIANIYAQAILEIVGNKFDYIHGPAYKGIPLAVLIVEKLWDKYGINKRWGYDRKEIKRYGDFSESLLVGSLEDGDRVLIVDDVITTGKTKIDTWDKLRGLRRIKPVGIFVAVDRRELSNEDLNLLIKCQLPIFSIVDICDIFNYLFSLKLISLERYNKFQEYFERYGNK